MDDISKLFFSLPDLTIQAESYNILNEFNCELCRITLMRDDIVQVDTMPEMEY